MLNGIKFLIIQELTIICIHQEKDEIAEKAQMAKSFLFELL